MSTAIPVPPAARQRLRVWDLPTRLFHWSLAASVPALIVTAKTGAMDWHFRLGYLVLALLLFRIVWGFVGGRWSRFSAFIYSPASLLAYLRGRAAPAHSIGHTPLGALSVFALLGALALQVLAGLASDDAITFTGPLAAQVPGVWSSAATDWHKGAGQWLVIALMVLHVAAVLVYVLFKRQTLVRPMLSGDKTVEDAPALPASRDDGASRLLALVLFGLCFGFARWVASLQG